MTSASALVAFVAVGCGTTPALSSSEALPQEIATTTTAVPTAAIKPPAAVTVVPAPTTSVQAAASPRPPSLTPSHPTTVQGSDPVAWTDAFCAGLADVISGVSALQQSDPSPQGQKDGLLEFSDNAQRAFTDTAHQLTQLGPPAITDGRKVQGTAVSFFTAAAQTVGMQRAQLVALDANDPSFEQKAGQLTGPDLSQASAQVQQLTTNPQLKPAFRAAPECQRLAASAGGR